MNDLFIDFHLLTFFSMLMFLVPSFMQLQSPIVQKMVKILEMTESSYHPMIKNLIGDVFDGKTSLFSFLKPNYIYLV